MLIVSDFNLDQMLPEHVAKVDPQIQNFNLSQLSQYSTHIHGGILDLVFHTSNPNTVSSLPSPYSDQNLAVNGLAFNCHYITHKYLC